MKKLIVLITLVLVLCGCAKDKDTMSISNGDDVLFEVAGEKYTKADLFDELKTMYGNDRVLASLKTKLAEKENIDFTELNEAALDYYDYLAQFGDYYIDFYGGKDAIIETYIAANMDGELVKNYVDKNLDEYVAQYRPVKMQCAYFDNEETAKALINMVNNGSNFDMAAAELGYTNDASSRILTQRDTSVPNDIKDFCLDVKATKGLSDVIKTQTSTTDANGNESVSDRFYVVNLIATDINEFKHDFLEHMSNNTYVDPNVAFNMTLKDHEVNIYDQDLYDSLSKTYEALSK